MRVVWIWILGLLLPACLPAGEDAPRELGNAADPQAYRAEIQLLEASLFHDGPLRPGEAGGIAFSLREIARRIRAEEQTRLGRIFAGEMERLAERIDSGRGDLGRSRAAMRQQWMRIRASLFLDATWYCWQPGEAPPIEPAFTPTVDARAVADLGHVIQRLDRVMRSARREVARLGEPQVDPDYLQTQYPEDAQRWREWSGRWTQELDAIERLLPAKPPLAGSVYSHRAAHEKVERALVELRRVPAHQGGWSFPTQAHTERCFDQASQYLASAQELLGQIQG